jgi:hypothetical protein
MKNEDTKTDEDSTVQAESDSVQRLVSPLKLTELRIGVIKYGDNAGEYNARITYESKLGDITLKLPPELSNDLLSFCGDAISKFGAEAAQFLNNSITESVKSAKEEAIFRSILG